MPDTVTPLATTAPDTAISACSHLRAPQTGDAQAAREFADSEFDRGLQAL
ncbi:hypothetical protein ACFYZE_10165 [Streptomyces sp. NPDC001796]